MNYKAFSSDLTSPQTSNFTSMELLEEAFRQNGVEQPTRQLGKGSFQSHLTVRSLDGIDFFADRYNTALSLNCSHPKTTVGLLFPRSANGKFICNGEEVGNSALIAFHGGSSLDIVTSAFSGTEAIAIPMARFNEMLGPYGHLHESFYSRQIWAIYGDTHHIEALRIKVLELLACSDTDLDTECLHNAIAATVSWLGDALSQYKIDRVKDYSTCVRIAKLAQVYLEEYFRESVHIEDVCKAAGISTRSLQRSFREYFDLTMTDYLRMLRLDAAHRDLLSANSSDDTVARIATDNGYKHLGRFSLEYRERYGQQPRETLKT